MSTSNQNIAYHPIQTRLRKKFTYRYHLPTNQAPSLRLSHGLELVHQDKDYVILRSTGLGRQEITEFTTRTPSSDGYGMGAQSYITRVLVKQPAKPRNPPPRASATAKPDAIAFNATGYFQGTRFDWLLDSHGVLTDRHHHHHHHTEITIDNDHVKAIWTALETDRIHMHPFDYVHDRNPAFDGGIQLFWWGNQVAQPKDVPNLAREFHAMLEAIGVKEQE